MLLLPLQVIPDLRSKGVERRLSTIERLQQIHNTILEKKLARIHSILLPDAHIRRYPLTQLIRLNGRVLNWSHLRDTILVRERNQGKKDGEEQEGQEAKFGREQR